MQVASVQQLIREIERAVERTSPPVLVALDGRSGVGKTSVSKEIADATNASIILQDDFYAGGTLAEWAKLSPKEKADRVIDWRRLRREALDPLIAGRVARWHPFDWRSMEGESPETIICEPRDVIILDGVYAARPELEDLIDLSILVVLSDGVRRKRLLDREGEGAMIPWHRVWDEAEDYYFNSVRPNSSFDVILNRG